ncbi:hypothetical protein CRM22_005839, partial [Opisthorchis felineus]
MNSLLILTQWTTRKISQNWNSCLKSDLRKQILTIKLLDADYFSLQFLTFGCWKKPVNDCSRNVKDESIQPLA